MRFASLFLVVGLVGCTGDDTNALQPSPDGGAPDASPDATIPDASSDVAPPPSDAPPDATPAPVTITVLDSDGVRPEPGILVAFDDASGALLGSATTDANGRATRSLPADAMVTVLFGSPTAPAILTVVGVQPGDALVAVDTSPGARPIAITSFPPDPPDAAASVSIRAGACSGYANSPPVVFALGPECRAKGATAILVTAEDATHAPLAWAAQKGIAIDPDAGLSGSPVALTAPYTTATGTATVTAAGAPSGASVKLFLTEIAGGLPFESGLTVDPSLDGGAPSHAFATHPGFADAIQAEAQIAGPGTSVAAIATRAAADGGASTIDLATRLPPLSEAWIDQASVARPIVHWGTDAGTFASADGVLVSLVWSSITQSGSWTLLAPPSATSVQGPALPPAAAAFLPDPGAGTTYGLQPNVAVVEASFLSGYDALRASFASYGAAVAFPPFTAAIVPPLPVDGTVRVTATRPTVE